MASVEMSRLQNGAVFWEKQLLVMFGVWIMKTLLWNVSWV